MNPLEPLIQALKKLPGIGEKNASRLALHIFRNKTSLANELQQAIQFIRDEVAFCQNCQNVTQTEICDICAQKNRHTALLCVVNEPIDLLVIEKTGQYQGLYHVLHGHLSPLEGIGPEQLRISKLVSRVQKNPPQEIILATDVTPEGEATALYLREILSHFRGKMSRLASGIPIGGTLEYTDAQTLSRSLLQRTDLGSENK